MRFTTYLRKILALEESGRIRMPDRRESLVVQVPFVNSRGEQRLFHIGFSWDQDMAVRAAFYAPVTDAGSDMAELLRDGCKAISRALQHGDRIEAMAGTFGASEFETPTGTDWRPASVFGAIALAGAELEAELRGERVA